ncbi:MAG: hypothetical protein ACE5KI_09030, partial [Dehalococcoidia bacterium]
RDYDFSRTGSFSAGVSSPKSDDPTTPPSDSQFWGEYLKRSRREERWALLIWIAASAVFFIVQRRIGLFAKESLIAQILYSAVVPLLLAIVVTFFLLPYWEKLEHLHARPPRIWRDVSVRLAILAAMALPVILGGSAWFGISLSLFLAGGFLSLAELLALITYMYRTRKVVAATESLLKM